MASPSRFAREWVTADEFSVPIKAVWRTKLAISSGVEGTHVGFPASSLLHTRRQSFATSPLGFSRAALVTKVHMTATMAATDEESAPPIWWVIEWKMINFDNKAAQKGESQTTRRCSGMKHIAQYWSDVSIYFFPFHFIIAPTHQSGEQQHVKVRNKLILPLKGRKNPAAPDRLK